MNKRMKLIPELRFPEFEKDGEWVFEPLNKVYFFLGTNSFSRNKLNYESGRVKNIHYGDIHTKYLTLFDINKENVPFINSHIPLERIKSENYCKPGDLIFADASEDTEDIGKSIEIINLNQEKLLAGLHTLLARQIESKLALGFGGYLFKSTFLRDQIKRESQGTKVLGISASRLAGVIINYPQNKKEQQKIAFCLSSLDELIAAHQEKLKTLKDHKKGLLQNLFPQAGEKLPKIRFPEFEKDGDWRRISIAEIMDSESSSLTLNKLALKEKGFPVYGADKIVGYINEYQQEEEYISIVKDGSGVGRLNFCEAKSSILGTLTYLKSKDRKRFDLKWIYYLLNTIDFTSYIKGSSIPHIYYSDYKAEVIRIPTFKEQQKISSCLSAVDELINAVMEKLEQLQQHKKGLMQGLFPKS